MTQTDGKLRTNERKINISCQSHVQYLDTKSTSAGVRTKSMLMSGLTTRRRQCTVRVTALVMHFTSQKTEKVEVRVGVCVLSSVTLAEFWSVEVWVSKTAVDN